MSGRPEEVAIIGDSRRKDLVASKQEGAIRGRSGEPGGGEA